MTWADVEQAIQTLRPWLTASELKTVSVLCAAYKVGAHQDRIAELTGYPLELVHDALLDLRGKMLIVGKSASEHDILRVLPGAQPLLQGLLLNKIPAIQPGKPELPTKLITSEVTPMEIELCDCGRPKRHRGYCKGKGPSKTKAQAAKPTATVSTAKSTVTVSGVSFSIRCEADGQKYEASGSTLEKFNAAMNVVERMLEA